MIANIKLGDSLKCLNCGKKIVLDGENFFFNFTGEYIKCIHCGAVYDVQAYHLHGEVFSDDEEEVIAE